MGSEAGSTRFPSTPTSTSTAHARATISHIDCRVTISAAVVTTTPTAARVVTSAIDESRSCVPHSAQGCTSRPLSTDDIHHNFDHLNCVSVTRQFGQCFFAAVMLVVPVPSQCKNRTGGN